MIEGLNTAEAQEKLKIFGFNELPSAKTKSIWRIALEVMKEPMFILLISCGVLYILLGDYREGIILLSAILVIIFITFYQYQKTEKALEALKKLSSPRALVIRDGKKIRIAADAKVLYTINLTVDELLLTGESVAVTKSVQTDASNSHGLVFSGTLVVQGKGFAKVYLQEQNLTNISKTRNVISVITKRNPVAIPILLTAIIMLLLIISIQSLQNTFNFEVTNYNHFMPSILGAIGILIILETIKYFKNRSIQNKKSLV